ncbi:MAG: hypothetical protein PUD65_07925 [Spirochaetales bacterium]|nr:hypothetical protein [Spirochaetales bacterium]
MRISNAAKAISSGDWQKALKGISSLTEEIANWKVTSGVFDDILNAVSSGSAASLNIYDTTLTKGKNIHDTWLTLKENAETLSSQRGNISDWEYVDLVVTTMLDAPLTAADVAAQGANLVASDLSYFNRTNRYLSSINNEIENSLKSKLEAATKQKEQLEADLLEIKAKLQKAIEGQRDTEKEQLRELRNEKEAALEKLEKSIAEMEKKLKDMEKAKDETELTDFTTSTLDTLTEAVNKITWDLYEEKTFDSWHRDTEIGYNL